MRTKKKTTEKQIAANRANAQKSTGPQTPAGKAKCSMNALRKGLYAGTVLLPKENPQEYDALRLLYQERLNPQTGYEQELVSQIAQIDWKRIRTEAIEASLLAEFGDESATLYGAEYARIMRVHAVLRRDRHKLRQELEKLQSARRKEEAQKPSERSEPPSPDPRPLTCDFLAPGSLSSLY